MEHQVTNDTKTYNVHPTESTDEIKALAEKQDRINQHLRKLEHQRFLEQNVREDKDCKICNFCGPAVCVTMLILIILGLLHII